jgi:MFS superfamily sulfate permease-like transporter
MAANSDTLSLSGMAKYLREDLLASIVVFLVALPLSMGVAIASGVPIEKAASVGLITAVIGGAVVGFIAGCPLQVSGPAAGLAVMVGQLIQEHGFEYLGVIILVAATVQIVAGLLGVGQWFRAVSPSLIEGMLAGIGVLILASQFHVMVDDKAPGVGKEHGGLINLVSIPGAVMKGFTEEPHMPAAAIGVLTIVVIILWNWLGPKKLKFIPAPLLGVIVGTIAAWWFQLKINYVPVPENLGQAFNLPDWSHFAEVVEGPILLAGLGVAFVASAESLLTATAVDSMQQHAPRTRYDRELIAQGTGNAICGMMGLMPMTGVIVRSSANVMAGARTRLSTILHGVWVLAFVLLLPALLRVIPISSLAAILVFTGYKLMKPATIRHLWSLSRGEALVYLVTMLVVIGDDLLTGIVVGLVVAFVRLMRTFTQLDTRLVEDRQTGLTHLHLKGAATFIRLPVLAGVLERVRPNAHLHVHLEQLSYIDHACLDLLVNWEKQHQAGGGELVMDWQSLSSLFQEHHDGENDATVRNMLPG